MPYLHQWLQLLLRLFIGHYQDNIEAVLAVAPIQ